MTTVSSDQQFEALLEYLRDTRGFDFTGYKRSSLLRRVGKRMEFVAIKGYSEYTDYLQVHPEEFTYLFNFLLINVTSFFRDVQIWDYMAEEIVPRLVKEKGEDAPIRAWCAGCASGEETYSTAMILEQAAGREAFRNRIKIYATDVDEDALTKARQAAYSEKEIEPIPPELRERYFERNGANYVFDKDLRRSIIFGRHDLVQDAPISKIDLLLCRNTLMYFNAETQARIMEHFHFALNDGGFLLLGKAEMLFTHVRSFVPIDLKRRVFTKVPSEDGLRERPAPAEEPARVEAQPQLGSPSREAAFRAGPVAQIFVDPNGFLAMANQKAIQLFDLADGNVGRRFRELDISYRPAELRTRIDQVRASGEPVTISDVAWSDRSGKQLHLDVEIAPLADARGTPLGTSVTFSDVTGFIELREELSQANQELQTAMEELQSTNEELETTNEELQSTNEELETTNEELQSTNEELETMNEELQSTNEELQAINDEVRERSGELDQVNAYLESILTGVSSAVIVLDRGLRVQLWSYRAEDLWGLRADEVKGQPFFNLDIGLGVDQLRHLIKGCMEDGSGVQEVRVGATNRRGRAITTRISCKPLRSHDNSVDGVILLMEEEPALERS